ncbi:MAG: hypothetical protein KAV99_04030, partial [Candidatus Latescibacteria bacterium]|nr:hypothetical protein [Candidatus Latescibacterota bacterium]
VVVVLAGMDKDGLKPIRVSLHLLPDGSDLHKIRSGTGDEKNFPKISHSAVVVLEDQIKVKIIQLQNNTEI